ncbi:MAG: SPOR domain-containing protein [Burkholderiales bacterium]
MADSPDAILLRRRARRRLVGAVALVVLVVVIVPVILDQQPRTVTQPLTVRIPGQDGGPFNTPVLPSLSSPRSAPKKGEAPRAADKSPQDPAAAGAPKSRAPEGKAAREGNKRARADEAEARRAKAPPEEDAYFVPLGAFIHSDNAKEVRNKASSVGIRSYIETIKVAQGKQTRVRAGPFSSRDAAEKARQKLIALGIDVGQVAQK